MDLTPVLSILSAIAKLSFIVRGLSLVEISLSLGITTRESTFFISSPMPRSACTILAFCSKLKGFVTTATVRISISLATSATTGAAPVPVPPPIPAAINTMVAPLRAAAISSRFSWAERSPISGLLPAPRPLVSFSPICTFVEALEERNAAASVFTAMNSTSKIPSVAMQLSAFPPPPPTPTTFILISEKTSSLSTENPIYNVLLI